MDKNSTGFKPKNLRTNNSKLIIDLFRKQEELSIQDLTNAVGLSKTSIIKIVHQLMDDGIVISAGKGSSTEEGGKRPNIYRLNPSYLYCISVLFTDYEYTGKIIDLKLQTIHTITLSYDCPHSYEEVVDNIVKIIQERMKMGNLLPEQLCGITIGMPGVINAKKGVIVRPTREFSCEQNAPLRQNVADRLPFETNIYFDNACRFGGYYELLDNEERQSRSVVVIETFEKSVGGCLIQQGELIQGDNGFVGEFGHIKTDYKTSRRCASCGNTGCFEATVCSDGLVADAGSRDYTGSALEPFLESHTLNADIIFQEANRGDELAQKVVDYAVNQFWALIQNIRFVCDPSEIIIQGLYSAAGEYFHDNLLKELVSMTYYDSSNVPTITFSDVDSMLSLHSGAALYCIDQYFGLNPD